MKATAGTFALAAAFAALLAGCGSSGSTTTVTQTHSTGDSRAAGTRPVQAPQPGSAAAKALVRRFYALLNTGRYESAWNLVPTSVRNEAGGFENWKAGYRTTVSSQPENVTVQSLGSDGNTIVLGLHLHAVDVDACSDRVSQEFAGTWTLHAAGEQWNPTSIVFKKIAGGTPSLTASDCGPSSTTSTTTQANCTPGYSPCLPPASDYDCEGGSGDGPKHTGEVQVTGSDPYELDDNNNGIGCEP